MTVRVLASKGDTAGAVQVARKMLLEHPEAVESYAETAELLVAGGRYREAVDLLSAGLEVLPENALLCNNRGLCHLLLGDLQGATSDFERAYQADRYDADYVGNLALVRALAGGAEAEREARALWARVLSEEAVEANLRQARKARARFER
jgi:Flp pilus assembly protein TadD